MKKQKDKSECETFFQNVKIRKDKTINEREQVGGKENEGTGHRTLFLGLSWVQD